MFKICYLVNTDVYGIFRGVVALMTQIMVRVLDLWILKSTSSNRETLNALVSMNASCPLPQIPYKSID